MPSSECTLLRRPSSYRACAFGPNERAPQFSTRPCRSLRVCSYFVHTSRATLSGSSRGRAHLYLPFPRRSQPSTLQRIRSYRRPQRPMLTRRESHRSGSSSTQPSRRRCLQALEHGRASSATPYATRTSIFPSSYARSLPRTRGTAGVVEASMAAHSRALISLTERFS